MKRADPRRSASAAPGRVRIIGGRWRGSRLDVPDHDGLRPTSDRVRETLFNWLAPVLPGARCLDLFAGSGALGFEAASRGAAEVTLLERDPALAAALGASARRLGAHGVRVECADALVWLQRAGTGAFDLAFLDPPFAAGLLDAAVAALPPWLAPEAWIYVECGREAVPAVPSDWHLHREGTTREVRYALYRRAAEAPATLRPGSAPQQPSPR